MSKLNSTERGIEIEFDRGGVSKLSLTGGMSKITLTGGDVKVREKSGFRL